MGWATFYGPDYEGGTLGCAGFGLYDSGDATIAASAYDEATGARPYACGAQLEVCGPAGCAVVTVKDACPGCSVNVMDLSDAANALVCGGPAHTCQVTIGVVLCERAAEYFDQDYREPPWNDFPAALR